jgi:D-glycero-D-manno-heptose 1,7-bisphosphate phosphatase
MKIVILDRDGVINLDSDLFIKSPDEWIAIPKSLDAIALLNQSGYRAVIATNQSGLNRGLFDMDTLNAMHAKMHQELSNAGGSIDAIFFCPHTHSENCNCRKPKAGMLLEIAQRFNVNLKHVPMVGDSLRDLQAAVLAECMPVLVLTGKGKKTLEQGNLPPNTLIYDDLYSFVVDWVEEKR